MSVVFHGLSHHEGNSPALQSRAKLLSRHLLINRLCISLSHLKTENFCPPMLIFSFFQIFVLCLRSNILKDVLVLSHVLVNHVDWELSREGKHRPGNESLIDA